MALSAKGTKKDVGCVKFFYFAHAAIFVVQYPYNLLAFWREVTMTENVYSEPACPACPACPERSRRERSRRERSRRELVEGSEVEGVEPISKRRKITCFGINYLYNYRFGINIGAFYV